MQSGHFVRLIDVMWYLIFVHRSPNPPKSEVSRNNCNSNGTEEEHYQKRFDQEFQKRRTGSLDGKEESTSLTEACICLRKPKKVFCGICGQDFEGQRIRKTCEVHPKAIFLRDLDFCTTCKCNDAEFFVEVDA